MTFNEYKESIQMAYGICQILQSNYDHREKNCGGTGNRTAPKGVSWIDYWRAMTDKTVGTLTCSCCGKEIFVGEPTETQKKEYTKGVDTIEKHRAHGGHLWINSPKDNSYVGGRYITPLCPDCNGQHGKDIIIKKGAVYCKELGAIENK